jgi:hypothetical protein
MSRRMVSVQILLLISFFAAQVAAAQSSGVSCSATAQVSVSCLQTPRIAIGVGAWNECSPVWPNETICIPYGDTPGLGGCACGTALS